MDTVYSHVRDIHACSGQPTVIVPVDVGGGDIELGWISYDFTGTDIGTVMHTPDPDLQARIAIGCCIRAHRTFEELTA